MSWIRLKALVTEQSRYIDFWGDICHYINPAVFLSLRPTALPLQTESQSIQNGDKSLGKDLLTPDDSAVTDLSPKTDSSPRTETPTKTDASSKTDVRPSTPGTSSSPQPKKGTVIDAYTVLIMAFWEDFGQDFEIWLQRFTPSLSLDGISDVGHWCWAIRPGISVHPKIVPGCFECFISPSVYTGRRPVNVRNVSRNLSFPVFDVVSISGYKSAGHSYMIGQYWVKL